MDERDYKAMNEELNQPSCLGAVSSRLNVLQAVRVLNLYACLGGNRYKWDEVANIEVTAVEYDAEIAKELLKE